MVELMAATVIIAIMAIGTASILASTGVSVRSEKNKRMAIERAHERMELVKLVADYVENGYKKMDDDAVDGNISFDKLNALYAYYGNTTISDNEITVNGQNRSFSATVSQGSFTNNSTNVVGYLNIELTIIHDQSSGTDEDIVLNHIVIPDIGIIK